MTKRGTIDEAGSRMRETLDRIARLILPPIDTLGGRGTIVVPLLLVLVMSLLTAAGVQPWVSAGLGSGGLENRTVLSGWLWTFALVSPGLAAMKGLVLAVAAWAMLVLLGAAPRLRPLLSTLLYGETVLALQGVWIVAAMALFGSGGLGPANASALGLGLDALVPGLSPPILALARNVTPFHLAWVGFLAVAFFHLGPVSRTKAVVTGIVLWFLVVSVGLIQALAA